MDISAIDSLECIIDGDTIVPVMNEVLPSDVGKTQFFNPSTGACTPDYTKAANQRLMYPGFYSSSKGKYIVPDANTEQWYINNPDSELSAILDAPGGAVLAKYKATYQKTSYKVNDQTFPALKIIGNVAGATQLNDVVIYCKADVNGNKKTCHGTIYVKESVGNIFELLVNCVNEDGISDTVIDNDTEYLKLDAQLQDSGVDVVATGAYSWMRSTAAGLIAVSHVAGVSEISNNGKTLKLYDGAIEGIEEYFAVVTHNNVTYKRGVMLADTHDPYYIAIGRSTKSNVVAETDTVKYTPSVLSRSSGAVQSGWSFKYSLRDNKGNVIRSASGSTFSVTGAEVKEHAGLLTHIFASKS